MITNNLKKINNESFEEWSERNEEELTILFAESGADRESDFDRENKEVEIFDKL